MRTAAERLRSCASRLQKSRHPVGNGATNGSGEAARAEQFLICPCDSGARLETGMDEEKFHLSIRSFLKMVGVNSQRQIEQAVAKAMASGDIGGSERLAATMNLKIAALKLDVQFDGDIKLE
jgi:hypothetical protein